MNVTDFFSRVAELTHDAEMCESLAIPGYLDGTGINLIHFYWSTAMPPLPCLDDCK